MFGLPPQTNADLLLAAVYYRAFYAPVAAEANPARGNVALAKPPEPAAAAPWLIPQPTTQTQTEHFADIETYLDRIG